MKKRFLFSMILGLMALPLMAQPTGQYSVKFSNGDDVFNGGLQSLSTSTLTVELWVKPTAFNHTIFTKMNGGDYPSNNGIALEILSTSQVRLSVGRDGARTMVSVNAALSSVNWNHIAVTYNSGTATLYLNGVSKGTASGGSTINSPYPILFGSFHSWGSYNLTGEIDDIRVFNTVRTPAQIASDMTSSEPEGALAFWKFDEGSGDTVADASGNGNTGFFGTSNGSADTNDPLWNQYNTTPDAPASLFATSNNGEVTVTWSKSDAGDVEGYAVYGGTESAPETKIGETLTASDTSFTFTDLTNGETYYFRVKAFDTFAAVSDYSPEDAAVVATDASRALTFDGSDDYVDLGNATELNVTGDLTLEAWIYADNYNQSGRIISKWGSASGYEIDLFEGSLRFSLNQSVRVHQASITSFNGTWVHIAAVKSSIVSTLYINGVAVGTGFAPTTISTSPNNLLIGRMANLAVSTFNGAIDEVRVWNVGRTASQIFDFYNSPLVGTESGLVGLWHLDEGTGVTAFDSTPNGNNGSHINGPVAGISGAMGGGTVPVELSSFTHAGGKLIWKTASETTNAGWEVEMSKPDPEALEGTGFENSGTDPSRTSGSVTEEWKTIGFVAGAGTSTEERSYSFALPEMKEAVRVRLKQLDTDGTVSYSQILTIEAAPAAFELLGNYPNPFNPTTVIRYQTSENSTVNLQVYDVTGRLVTTLVDGKKDAGVHEAEFNAAGLSSGLYFYRISAGNFSAVKTMMLVK
ncbi:MAG: T9SS type A sorting domain-containing protein [Bacteroidetes bacterium]|nr:T9SS type A sorting domain-containing protein [Bacteroidota bacterium]